MQPEGPVPSRPAVFWRRFILHPLEKFLQLPMIECYSMSFPSLPSIIVVAETLCIFLAVVLVKKSSVRICMVISACSGDFSIMWTTLRFGLDNKLASQPIIG